MSSNTNDQTDAINPPPGNGQQNTSTSSPPQPTQQRPAPLPLFTIGDRRYAAVPVQYRQGILDMDNNIIMLKNEWDAMSDDAKEIAPYTEFAGKLRPILQQTLSTSLYGGDMNQDPAEGSDLIHRTLLSLWRSYNPEIFGREQAHME